MTPKRPGPAACELRCLVARDVLPLIWLTVDRAWGVASKCKLGSTRYCTTVYLVARSYFSVAKTVNRSRILDHLDHLTLYLHSGTREQWRADSGNPGASKKQLTPNHTFTSYGAHSVPLSYAPTHGDNCQANGPSGGTNNPRCCTTPERNLSAPCQKSHAGPGRLHRDRSRYVRRHGKVPGSVWWQWRRITLLWTWLHV